MSSLITYSRNNSSRHSAQPGGHAFKDNLGYKEIARFVSARVRVLQIEKRDLGGGGPKTIRKHHSSYLFHCFQA